MAYNYNESMFDNEAEQEAFDWLTDKGHKGLVNPDNFARMVETACAQFGCDDRNVWNEFCNFMNGH